MNPDSQAHPPTRLILPWPKVSEVTQDSRGLMGSQESGVFQESPAYQACLACPPETTVT